MFLKLNRYIKDLYSKSAEYKRTDINNTVDDSFWSKYLMRGVFIFISIGIFYVVPTGYSTDFIEHISGILAILVGLFITTLIFSFEKFYTKKKVGERFNEKLKDIQDFNFTRIFTNLTSYTILLSILAIILVSIYVLFNEYFSLDVSSISFDLKSYNIGLTVRTIIVSIIRITTFYVLLNIVYNTVFVVVTMNHYMNNKLDE